MGIVTCVPDEKVEARKGNDLPSHHANMLKLGSICSYTGALDSYILKPPRPASISYDGVINILVDPKIYKDQKLCSTGLSSHHPSWSSPVSPEAGGTAPDL